MTQFRFKFVVFYTRESLVEISDYAQHRLTVGYIWISKNQGVIYPFIIGLAFSILSIIIMYLDSSVPGIVPQSPFSPRSKYHYRQQINSAKHMAYVTAIGSGVIVTGLMLWNLHYS